ncbi:isochorismatase family protein [Brevibacterium sp. VCM10]|uniref:isochorismatase family protein n=1 Tax=Brevibacterium sp. VCM10 TaxID=1381751 RepID=UPI0018CBFD08|nr:isochorismatase family protein [Brevibacterium sp. VCM10]
MSHKLNASEAVMIFGDLQEGITDLQSTSSEKDLRRSAGALARIAELHNIPTLALSIPNTGGENPSILSEIEDARSEITYVHRTRPDSFEVEDFRTALDRTGRTALIVCGVATEIVVMWLALSGAAKGYRVHLVVDACGALSKLTGDAALSRIEAAGVTLTSVYSLASEVSGDFTVSPGKETIDIVYELVSAGHCNGSPTR